MNTARKIRTIAILALATPSFYEGEGGSGEGGTGAGGTGAGGTGTGTGTGAGNMPPAGTTKTYTEAELQAELNKRDQEAKKQNKERNQKVIEDLERYKNLSTTTTAEKERLQQQIDDLTRETQTKEEQHRAENEKWEKKYNTDTKKLQDESSSWRRQYESTLLDIEIRDAAKHPDHKAFSDKQVAALLKPLAFFKEELRDGKPTGRLIPQIRYPGKDKDGNDVELILSPKDAVKAMSEQAEHANLFENKATGGFGNQNEFDVGSNGKIDLENMSDAEYEKNREKILRSVK